MPPSKIFFDLILLAHTCPFVSGGFRIAYPLASNESHITPSKYVTHRPLVSNEFRIAPSKYATHGFHVVAAHDRQLETFYPPTTFQTFGDGIDQPPSFGFGPTTLEQMAVAITQSQLGIDSTNIHFQSGFSEGPDTFAYVRQSYEGVPFANAVANVALYNNRIVSFGSSFVKIMNITVSDPSLDVQSVIPNAESALNGKFNDHPPTLEYLVQSDGSIALTYVVQIQNDNTGTWFEAFMDAHSGDILSITDFVSEALYKVVPITKGDFSTGQVTLVNPQDPISSPMGWHSYGGTGRTTTTSGNNVVAFKVIEAGKGITTRETRASLVFDYTYMDTLDPELGENVDAALTNAFYVINMMHDIAYQYGFKEKSYNFQIDNFEKGGRGNDPIKVYVQDKSRINNAWFGTPPDGQPGICRLYLWDKTSPRRDAAMDNGLIVHEFTHGITARKTGGGLARCLQTVEARSLSEGWSDAMAEWVQQNSTSPLLDYAFEKYVTNSTAGARAYPYSTSKITNPLRYSSIKLALREVHNMGEVWANMLHNVYAALVMEHGFSKKARTDPRASGGNVIFMHLFIDALSIQPCNPTFRSARDAWIQADKNRYRGLNRCLLWTAFASRGLGVNAVSFVDDSSVPDDCVGWQPKPKPAKSQPAKSQLP